MDITQIFLILAVFMCGLLTGYLVGRDKDPRYAKTKSNSVNADICTHETAIVRSDGNPAEGSLLVCEKCGSEYGNFASLKH